MFSEDTDYPSRQAHHIFSLSGHRGTSEGLPIISDEGFTQNPFSPFDDGDHVLGFKTSFEPDRDQKISMQLAAVNTTDFIHDNTFSAPVYEPTPHIQSDEMSMSPAAMFLSTFTPSSSSISSSAIEGQTVSGYVLGPVVGYGGFSTIRRASSSSGGTVAVKIVKRADISKQPQPSLVRKRLDHEAAVWASLSHEHILPLFSTIQTSDADFFITLFCPAGSLFDILKRDGRPALPHDDAGMMFRQVVRGLRYLHEVVGLVHRDMKLENVLVDEMGVCRIGDFGMSRKIGEIDDDPDEELISQDHSYNEDTSRPATSLSRRHTKQGLPLHLSLIRHHSGPRHRNSTPLSLSPASSAANIFQPGSLPYAAPELLLPQMSTPLKPHPAQDMWALGIMLYTMLVGNLPFRDSFEPRLQMKIMHGVYEVPSDVGRSAERVLRGCLERSVPSRWSIAMVDEIAWGIGWGDDSHISTPEEDEEFQIIEHPVIQSPVNDVDDWNYSHDLTKPSTEALRRRSSSRVRRSLSRAPALSNRSASRQGHLLSPTFSALNHSILSASSSSATSPSSTRDDSALLLSPCPSLERGRRLEKSPMRSTSRSPSLSIVPKTPTDFDDRSPSFSEYQGTSRERDSSRGRKSFGRGGRTPRPDHLYPRIPSGEPLDSSLDILHERERWTPSSERGRQWSPAGQSRSHQIDLSALANHRGKRIPDLYSDINRWRDNKGRRPGSTPPAQANWPVKSQSRDDAGVVRFSAVNSQAIPIPLKSSTRSRSVGHHANDRC